MWHPRRTMLRGAGASPKTQNRWRTNPDGAWRTLEEALAIGRRNGVDVDDELFRWVMGSREEFEPGELAAYGELRNLHDESAIIPHRRFLTRGGQYCVRLHPQILTSDDAILAVLIHETHEIRALDGCFGASGALTVRELRSLIDARLGRLHCEAWDEADRRVLALIEEDEWP